MSLMKSVVLIFASLAVNIAYSAETNPSIQNYWSIAEQKKLDQDITWQRLMYANKNQKSEVTYAGYFLSENGKNNLKEELKADISALFIPTQDNQSIRCKFPARSQWLIQQLGIQENELPQVKCSEFENWIGQIKPYKATLIYATDFMGNPSSMFGHTLLRLDPKDQQQLNLVSYAVNYAATVAGNDNWSYAWKGLTGQYPGEYSLMPYYRKVKEYGDFESRDLWEYELNLSPEETRFLVSHIWEMQHVSFPYYFVSDNCAYRLLGLVDLVKPESHLQEKFNYASIPMETIKAMQQQGLTKAPVYRPALETQLLAQAHQHGASLAKVAHQLAMKPIKESSETLKSFSPSDQAKILEMAYDDLYLQFIGRKVEESFAQPQLRQLLALRSQIDLDKQRQEPKRPSTEPTQGHNARNVSLKLGEVQGDKFIEIGHRQAYHDLIDPQGGYRAGTQLLFLNGNAQWRDDHLKLEHLDLLEVNSYNPIQPFKTPLTWGFNLGWRVGVGPTLGCMNQWLEKFNTVVQVELPYWEDQNQWNLRLNTQWQYAINSNNAIRFNWDYEKQNHLDWMKSSLGYVWFF
ncbi:DUF4105 domain-containing protein [Acinetobacter baumannii]